MPRSIIFALMTFGLLSACSGKLGGPPPAPIFGGTYSHSIGFTGVGATHGMGVPRPVAVSQRSTYVHRQGAASTGIIRVNGARYASKSRHDQAKIAIRAAGKVPDQARPVVVSGQATLLTLVDVGTTRFAVLRNQASRSNEFLKNGTNFAFAESIPTLTGCRAEGGGYGLGLGPAKPKALAMPILCD
ncbi:MAG: hypothetical protein ACSHWS_10410 [Sulfitobacter sp.]